MVIKQRFKLQSLCSQTSETEIDKEEIEGKMRQEKQGKWGEAMRSQAWSEVNLKGNNERWLSMDIGLPVIGEFWLHYGESFDQKTIIGSWAYG